MNMALRGVGTLRLLASGVTLSQKTQEASLLDGGKRPVIHQIVDLENEI